MRTLAPRTGDLTEWSLYHENVSYRCRACPYSQSGERTDYAEALTGSGREYAEHAGDSRDGRKGQANVRQRALRVDARGRHGDGISPELREASYKDARRNDRRHERRPAAIHRAFKRNRSRD